MKATAVAAKVEVAMALGELTGMVRVAAWATVAVVTTGWWAVWLVVAAAMAG